MVTYQNLPNWPPHLWRKPEGTPLTRMQVMLDTLGNPERRLPPTVHVAGTNGKGSTIAMLSAILNAAGYSSHRYTTPHMSDFRERITLAGEEISQPHLDDLVTRCRATAPEAELEFFEGTTALALLAFVETPADALLLEVGCGGGMDATNIIPEKALSVISTISYDHIDTLGHRLPDIARHKLGILREGVPAIVGYQPPEIVPMIQTTAEEIGAPLYMHGLHWAVSETADGIRFEDAQGAIDLPKPALLGQHQILNAGLAIAAAKQLREFDISPDAMAHGMKNATHSGRLQKLALNNHPNDTHPAYFDGGHNLAAAAAMAEALPLLEQEKTTLILGTTDNKDLRAVLYPFREMVKQVYCIPVTAEPCCAPPEALVKQAEELGINATFAPSLEAAISRATQATEPCNLLIFGSLFLYPEAKALGI